MSKGRVNRVPEIGSASHMATEQSVAPYSSPYIYEPWGVRDRVNGKWVSRSLVNVEYHLARRRDIETRARRYGTTASTDVSTALDATHENPPAEWEKEWPDLWEGDEFDKIAAALVHDNTPSAPRVGNELWQEMPSRVAAMATHAGALAAAVA